MNQAALDFAAPILSGLQKADASAIGDLRRNFEAHIANANAYVEPSSDLTAVTESLRREVRSLLDQYAGPIGYFDKGPGSEAQRQRAINAAIRYEEVLRSSTPSSRARILGF